MSAQYPPWIWVLGTRGLELVTISLRISKIRFKLFIHSGRVTSIDQSEASIQVIRQVLTNQRPVIRSRDQYWPIRDQCFSWLSPRPASSPWWRGPVCTWRWLAAVASSPLWTASVTLPSLPWWWNVFICMCFGFWVSLYNGHWKMLEYPYYLKNHFSHKVYLAGSHTNCFMVSQSSVTTISLKGSLIS